MCESINQSSGKTITGSWKNINIAGIVIERPKIRFFYIFNQYYFFMTIGVFEGRRAGSRECHSCPSTSQAYKITIEDIIESDAGTRHL